ncbi:TetR/AcrR family transcriptional regulator [Balneolaceae bacterium YR4-1]|uniref:TetR/AcrR family transcriptional regulator n=1 Tax=Halalkalibaculum roseum TaxID=2709311 RepID=A0A6M1SX83_9BACT|nr:TetR/AcrR family transcriptional regulator [Halalkalibaculum roseum]NGP75704.1 TetR/AcrR family transcriptional regulator [Halalkalibaculum roseum]
MCPRSPTKNEEIRQQTRRQIRNAAFELFAAKGFAQTSVRSIAEKAGISKGLIYHYFDGKDDILHAIFNDLTEVGKEALNFPEDLSSSERLRKMLHMIFSYIEHATEVVRLMVSLALQPDAVEKLKSSIDAYNERQIRILAPLFEDLGYDNPKLEAYYLAAKLDGITLGYLTLGKDYPFAKMKEKVMNDYGSKI